MIRIVDLAGLPVFHGATVRTIVLLTERTNSKASSLYSPPPDLDKFRSVQAGTMPLDKGTDSISYEVPASALGSDEWNLAAPDVAALMLKMHKDAVPLTIFVEGRICRGIVSGLTEAFVISHEEMKQIVRANPEAKKIIHPFLQGRCIRRYSIEPENEYLIYTPRGIDMSPYPAVQEHLRPFRKKLEQRATKQEWYELQQPQLAYKQWFEAPKIIFPDIATSCRFSLDNDGHFGANTVYFIPTNDLALLGLLNSQAAAFFFKQICAALEGPGEAYLRFFGQYLDGFPVRLPKRKKQHDRLVELVQQMLDLHQRLAEVKGDHEKTALQRQIDATDQQIDQLAYQLYDLTPDEIRLVEESTNR
ncbi:MAG TPA: TaqI-like C-terminal specificity domain-containing protein [Pirellulales bacterium]|nr:TaqI-like C-terminal specificity domain-containing protein [Pirellulales bacterium]